MVVLGLWDDTEAFPRKRGKHSVRSDSVNTADSVGKQEQLPCRGEPVSGDVEFEGLPISYRLYLPKEWADDSGRRRESRSSHRSSVSKPNSRRLPWEQDSGAAVAANVVRGIVLADAAYGINTEFRDGLTQPRDCNMVVGVARLDDGMGAREKAFTSQAAREKWDRFLPRLLQRTH